MRVLLGVTGSVAAVLTPRIVQTLEAAGHEVRVLLTKSALYFVDGRTLAAEVFTDEDEWPKEGYRIGEPILHIALRKWADVLLIAPLSANTLSVLAHAGATNLLTSVVRAWNLSKLIVLAPAMNTAMWSHPATAEQLAVLNRWYRLRVVPPQHKTLACGDTGVGALASIADVVSALTGGKES